LRRPDFFDEDSISVPSFVDSEEIISASVNVRARKALSEGTTKLEKKIELGKGLASRAKKPMHKAKLLPKKAQRPGR